MVCHPYCTTFQSNVQYIHWYGAYGGCNRLQWRWCWIGNEDVDDQEIRKDHDNEDEQAISHDHEDNPTIGDD